MKDLKNYIINRDINYPVTNVPRITITDWMLTQYTYHYWLQITRMRLDHWTELVVRVLVSALTLMPGSYERQLFHQTSFHYLHRFSSITEGGWPDRDTEVVVDVDQWSKQSNLLQYLSTHCLQVIIRHSQVSIVETNVLQCRLEIILHPCGKHRNH